MSLGEGEGGRGAWSNVGSRDTIDGYEMAGLQRRVEDGRGRIRRGPSMKAKMEHVGAKTGTGTSMGAGSGAGAGAGACTSEHVYVYVYVLRDQTRFIG